MLTLRQLDLDLAVVRLSAGAEPPQPPASGFYSLTTTPDEVSVICEAGREPAGFEKREAGWRCFVVQGPLPFEMTGVLASVAQPLAEAEIPIFAVSTFDTDYVLVKAEDVARARSHLESFGHTVLC